MEKFINSDVFKLFVKKLPNLMYNTQNKFTKNGKLTPDANNHKEGAIGHFFKKEISFEDVQTIVGENARDLTIYNIDISVKCKQKKLKEGSRKLFVIKGSGDITLVWTTIESKTAKYLENYKPKCYILYVEVFINETNMNIKTPSIYIFPPEVQDLSHGTKTTGRGLSISSKTLKKWKADPRTMIFDCEWPPYVLVKNGSDTIYESIYEETMMSIN